MNTAERTEAGRETLERERVERLMEGGAVFVFGSNRRGVHGAGAAKVARQRYGARWGAGEGLVGRSYAIPTKETHRETLPLAEIEKHVGRFLRYAETRPGWTFAVTRVGCGFAGYTDEQIAPMFSAAPDNCKLPKGWRALATQEPTP